MMDGSSECGWAKRVTGSITKVINAFNLENTKRRTVLKVFEDVTECRAKGTIYDADRKYSSWADEKLLIPSESDEYQLVGNSMEDGHGLLATTELVNESRCVQKKDNQQCVPQLINLNN